MSKSLISLCVLAILGLMPEVHAQSAAELLRTNRYTEAIEQLRGAEKGPEAFQLGQAHMRRAYVLRDLARLQAQIGAAYYTARDTSEEFRSTPWSQYYAARYWVAIGAREVTQQSFRTIVDDRKLSAEYSSRSRIWIGFLQHQNGNESAARDTWESVTGGSSVIAADRALAYWRAGRPLPQLDCEAGEDDPAALRCSLWEALQQEDWSRLTDLQGRLLNGNHLIDEVATFEDFGVRFYDPGTLKVLAITDFRAAAAAYQQVSGEKERQATLLTGVCAVEGRDHQTARLALQDVSHPFATVYRAVLEQEAGRDSDARRLWRTARTQAENAAERAVWAQEGAPYKIQTDPIRAYIEKKAKSPPERKSIALRLGRAALSLGNPEAAYRFLDANYQVGQSNDLRSLDPAYLVVFAHAKFRLGPRHREEVLRHLNALREWSPIASGIDDLARAFYTPEDTHGQSRSGG